MYIHLTISSLQIGHAIRELAIAAAALSLACKAATALMPSSSFDDLEVEI